MSNLKNTQFTKKLTLMNLKSRKKSLNLFLKEFRKKQELQRDQSKYLDQLFTNNQLSNQLLIKRKSSWKSLMVLKGMLRDSQKYYLLNLMRLLEFKRKLFQAAQFINNIQLNLL